MTIETKFDIGQRVWTIQNDIVHDFIVTKMIITVYRNNPTEITLEERRDVPLHSQSEFYHSGDRCFATKQELLDSL